MDRGTGRVLCEAPDIEALATEIPEIPAGSFGGLEFSTAPYLGLFELPTAVAYAGQQTILGQVTQCFHVEAGFTNEGDVCLTSDGIPLRIENRGTRFEYSSIASRIYPAPVSSGFQEPLVPIGRWQEVKGVDIALAEINFPASPLVSEFMADLASDR
jgi:hypothetical protein